MLDLGVLTVVPYALAAGLLVIFKLYMTGGRCRNEVRMEGKTVVITGANTGIGKATAREMLRRGARVILACRNPVLGHTAARDLMTEFDCPDRVDVGHLDLASMSSIRSFADKILNKEPRLDVLINNAGVMWCPHALTQDGFEMQIGVNHLGHFLLTNLLLERLSRAPQARIITLTSIAHYYATIKQDDLNSKLSYRPSDAYAQSKLANVLFTKELARRTKGTRITTYAVHPGVVRTDLGRYMDILNYPLVKYLVFPLLQPLIWLLTKSPTQGAQTSVYCATEEQLKDRSGGYYSDCAEQVAGKSAQDERMAAWLWETSVELCGLRAEGDTLDNMDTTLDNTDATLHGKRDTLDKVATLDEIPAPIPVRGEETLGTSRAN